MKNRCSWCTLPTNLPVVFAAKSPLLEWLEKKIDKNAVSLDVHRDDIWGENADWSELQLGDKLESELIAYDELITTITRKYICEKCLIEDQRLSDMYYPIPEDDMDFTIDDLT
jgi:hypothetical protein|tara:strand:- start:3900 stop:4238 length:339 start_codon:yes stop_codon:yes gene_type:complete